MLRIDIMLSFSVFVCLEQIKYLFHLALNCVMNNYIYYQASDFCPEQDFGTPCNARRGENAYKSFNLL